MMDNLTSAESIITHGMKNDESPARIAKHLANYGLLVEDLPEPCIYPDTGEHEWHMDNGYVSVEDGIIHVIHDETDDDWEPAELDSDPCEIRIGDTTKGRETAWAILAACDLKDAQDA